MDLPLLDGMEEALYIENKAKCRVASYHRSRKGRTKRQLAKRRHRGKEQEDRKKWGKGYYNLHLTRKAHDTVQFEFPRTATVSYSTRHRNSADDSK